MKSTVNRRKPGLDADKVPSPTYLLCTVAHATDQKVSSVSHFGKLTILLTDVWIQKTESTLLSGAHIARHDRFCS